MIESSILVLRNTQRNGIPDTVSVYVTLINLNNISMKTFHSDLFMNLFAFFSADNASDFNNSAQSISVVLSHIYHAGTQSSIAFARKIQTCRRHGSLGTHTFGVIKKQFGRHNKEQYT